MENDTFQNIIGLYDGSELFHLLEDIVPSASSMANPTIVHTLESIQSQLVELLAKKVDISPVDINMDDPFTSYGVSSIDAMTLSGEIEEWIGFRLSPTILYDYPSISSISKFLLGVIQSNTAQSKKDEDVIDEIMISPENLALGDYSIPTVDVEKLIGDVTSKGIALWNEQGDLHVRSSRGILTTEMQEQLRKNCRQILGYIGDRKYFPLSVSQQRYLILTILQSGKAAYNNPIGIQIKGTLDKELLEKALLHLIKRHDILRGIFPTIGRISVQVIQPATDSFRLQVVDVSTIFDKRKREEQVRKIARSESSSPLDPVQGPNLRMKLVKISQDEHLLLITVHHTLFDGFSFMPFIEEMFDLYKTFQEGREVNKPLPVQYVDYVLLEPKRVRNLEKELIYWKENLKDAPPFTKLPLDFPRPEMITSQGDSEVMIIPNRILNSIKNIATNHHVSLFVGLLAALKLVLLKWTQQEDIIVGTVVQNRDKQTYSNVLGDFTNFLPLRSTLSTNQTYIDLLNQLDKTVWNSLEHKALPFEKIVEISPKGPTNINRVYNIHVNHLPSFTTFKVGDSLEISITNNRILSESSMMDLRFEWNEGPDGLHLVCEYSTDIFTRSTVQRLLENYTKVLNQIINNPSIQQNEIGISGLQLRQQSRQESSKIYEAKASRQLFSKDTEYFSKIENLRGIFAIILETEVSQIDVEQNFFEMGGSSLKAVQLIKECEAHSIKIGITEIFKFPSVSLLAEYLWHKENGSKMEKPRVDKKVESARAEAPAQIPNPVFESRELTRRERLTFLRRLRKGL